MRVFVCWVGLGWVGVWEVGCEERCVKWVVR
jgi:hypothetical protein